MRKRRPTACWSCGIGLLIEDGDRVDLEQHSVEGKAWNRGQGLSWIGFTD